MVENYLCHLKENNRIIEIMNEGVMNLSDGLFKKIEELMALNDTLSNKTFKIYKDIEEFNLFDRSTVGFEERKYDSIAIEYDKDFEQHKRIRIVAIYSYRNKQVNEQLLNSLFEVKKRSLNRRINKISEDNVGTCLNIVREFWNDLYIDLKRHELQQ